MGTNRMLECTKRWGRSIAEKKRLFKAQNNDETPYYTKKRALLANSMANQRLNKLKTHRLSC
jgi:hypothetical protein